MFDDAVLRGAQWSDAATMTPESPSDDDPAFAISGAALVNERLREVEELLRRLIPEDAAPAERVEAIESLAACVRAVARLEERLAEPGISSTFANQ